LFAFFTIPNNDVLKRRPGPPRQRRATEPRRMARVPTSAATPFEEWPKHPNGNNPTNWLLIGGLGPYAPPHGGTGVIFPMIPVQLMYRFPLGGTLSGPAGNVS